MTKKWFKSLFNWVIFPLTQPQVAKQQQKKLFQILNISHTTAQFQALKKDAHYNCLVVCFDWGWAGFVWQIKLFIFSIRLSIEASYFDWINVTENRLEFDRKNSHQRTLTLEHDRKFTPTNINHWTWPKYGQIWPEI